MKITECRTHSIIVIDSHQKLYDQGKHFCFKNKVHPSFPLVLFWILKKYISGFQSVVANLRITI